MSFLAICVPIKLFSQKPRELFGIPMTDSQREILSIIDNNQHMMISSPRQMGKTVVCLGVALETMLSKPYANVMWLSPNGGMARNSADRFRAMVIGHRMSHPIRAIPLDVPDIKVISDNKYSMQFDNGSYIQFQWGSPDAAKSQALDLLFYDETAYINNMEYMWPACQPTISSQPDSKSIMISTPQQGSWFNKKFLDEKFDIPKFQIEQSADCFSDWSRGFAMYPDQRDQEYLGKVF